MLLWSIVLLQMSEPPEPPDTPGDVIIQVVGTGEEGRWDKWRRGWGRRYEKMEGMMEDV